MSARAIVDAGDGSVTVRSIRYRAGSAPRWEAEVVLTTPAVRVLFALDREAVRNLRETLHEGPAGTIEGEIREFTPGVDEDAEAALDARRGAEEQGGDGRDERDEQRRDDDVFGRHQASPPSPRSARSMVPCSSYTR